MNKSYRILIVDDNPTLREGMKSLLSQFPAFDIVGEAADGVEAIESAQRLHPDLVLMDISMPRMNGLSATSEIKKKRPGTKVLIFSVHKIPEYLTAALDAGADGCLPKDCLPAELVQSVEDILAGKQRYPSNFMEVGTSGRFDS
jgi:DNA-binding NarL/FixJ family response regulator